MKAQTAAANLKTESGMSPQKSYRVIRGKRPNTKKQDSSVNEYDPLVSDIGVDNAYAALALAIFGQNVHDTRTGQTVSNRHLHPSYSGVAINILLGFCKLTKDNSVDCELCGNQFIENDGINGKAWGSGWDHTGEETVSTTAQIPSLEPTCGFRTGTEQQLSFF